MHTHAYIWTHMDTCMNESIASGWCIALPFLFFSNKLLFSPTLRPGVALPCRVFVSPENTNFLLGSRGWPLGRYTSCFRRLTQLQRLRKLRSLTTLVTVALESGAQACLRGNCAHEIAALACFRVRCSFEITARACLRGHHTLELTIRSSWSL